MGNEIESSENQSQQQLGRDHDPKHNKEDEQSKDEKVLQFMDSLDSYLSSIHSLSSTLRQGWFDFASARHSMGASRVNCVLLDLKEHPAATRLEVSVDEEPHFNLCKWASVCAGDSQQIKDEDSVLKPDGIRQRHKDNLEPAEPEEDSPAVIGPLVTVEGQVQKERIKSLAVFGTLVSPKLRSAQLSFETALETLVEIANARASLLSSFNQVREHVDGVQH